jgi:HemY protein
MARTLVIFFSALTILALGLGWLADSPGHVAVDWQGYRLETSFAALVVAACLLLIVIILLIRFVRWIVFGHSRSVEWLMRRAQDKGDKAIARGLTALAAGDAAQALKQAERAQGYLKNSHFVPLLQAQAARLSGDSRKAAGYYQKLARQPETDLLGLRGLLYQALEAGDHEAALKLASRAVSLRPRTGWALNALFDLALGARDWKAAERATAGALKAGIISAEDGRRRRAILMLTEAAETRDDAAREKLVMDAYKTCPGLLPAAIRAAEILVTTGKARRAATVIADAWAQEPHPRLAELYRSLIADKTPADQVRAMEAFTQANRTHEESRLALAATAVDAHLPGMAKEVLKPLLEAPTPRAARLMAAMAEAAGDMDEERSWLSHGIIASRPDPRWRCHHCGWEPEAWEAICRRCHSFDSIAWETPLLALDGPEGPKWMRLSEPGLIG